MRTQVSLLSLIVLIFMLLSCDKKVESNLDNKFEFDFTEYEKDIANIFNSNDSTGFVNKTLGSVLDTLNFIYAGRNYQPIFINNFKSKSFIDSLINIFGKADEHGLNPEFYNYTLIQNEFIESIKDKKNKISSYLHLANTEILITDGIIRYASHMRHGAVNPRVLYPNRYFLPFTDSLNKKFLEPLKQNNVIKYLLNIQPKSNKYKKLQTALKHFYSLINIKWVSIPVPNKKIEIGQTYSDLSLIAQRLAVLGFIDTSKIKINGLTFYDTLIAESIKEFQKVNGLTDDGTIGKSTIERLNITPKEYIDKIKLNLERFRWFDYSDTSKYVTVNLPDFKLYTVENGGEKFNMNVCAGRKGKWETLNMYGQISYFVLNPTWSVPRSIIDEEIVSGLRRDSSYLKKRSFKVYKSGVRVSLNGLTAKDLSSYRNYSIVQDPGAGNALGKIKFMFKNPFGIYLHDTPTRSPFKNNNRAVSHGCVRVEKPIQLAEYFLNNNSNWNINYLKIEIGQKIDNQSIISEFKSKRSELRKNSSYGITTEVKLNKYIPLFIDYYTLWVDGNGKLNYREDIYNRDKILAEHLLMDNLKN